MSTQEPTPNAAGGASALTDVLERMRARADNAYCDYIGQLRRDECLGWEIKVERGKFGEAELKAHCAAAEKLGRHRALHEAAKMLEEAREQIAEVIRIEEREACAAECDRLTWALDHGGNKYRRPAEADKCAEAIRMRSNDGANRTAAGGSGG